MTNPTDAVLSLVDAMERAKQNKATDDEKQSIDHQVTLCQKIDELCYEMAQRKILSGEEILNCLAITLGMCIKTNRNGGPTTGLLIAVPLCQKILNISTED